MKDLFEQLLMKARLLEEAKLRDLQPISENTKQTIERASQGREQSQGILSADNKDRRCFVCVDKEAT